MKIYKYKERCNISGDNIHQQRIKLKISQDQLAARLQVEGLPISQKAVSRIETGERVVADYELLFFARVLSTTTDSLLSEK
jgi:transcriptional regulator with XRE-family HTH domain